MENRLDILASFIGAFIMCYGLFCFSISRIRVGFRGMRKMILVGRKSKVVSVGYVTGGFVICITSLLSWLSITSIPRFALLTVCALGGLIVFSFYLAGTVIAEFVEHQ